MTGISTHAVGGDGTPSTGLFVVRSTIPHVYRSNLYLIVRFWSMPQSTFVAFWNFFDRVFCSTTTMMTRGRKESRKKEGDWGDKERSISLSLDCNKQQEKQQ